MFYYNYVLQSLKDTNFIYKGCTNNLKKRIREHHKGLVISTRGKRPLKLIYYEACLDKKDAYRREKTLKSGYGAKFLKFRLRKYFEKT